SSIPGFSNFSLDNANLDDTFPTQIVVNNLSSGSYTITESVVQNFTLTGFRITGDDDNGSATDTTTRTATIDLDPGENIRVTFENSALPPQITGLSDITVVNDSSQCSASVTIPTPTVVGGIGNVNVTTDKGLPGSSTSFEVGINTIIYDASDQSTGLSAVDTITVTVNDTEAPTITCPSDINVDIAPGVMVSEVFYSTPFGNDNCPNAVTKQTVGLPSGSNFPLGTTTNTFVVTDASGNTNTCSFTVTVTALAAPFITTWKTSDGSITIPTTGTGYNYDVFYVNTSDSTDNGSLSAQVGDVTISDLSTSATYRVEISGDFPRIFFNGLFGSSLANARKIQTIQQWGDIAWTSMGSAFWGCSNLTYTATDAPDLSGVTDMSSMFRSASSFNGAIGNWDTQNVTTMISMFEEATAFNGAIGNWNTQNVTSMRFMFLEATAFNQDIGNWNTQNVTSMRFMFSGASSFNQDIGNWNTQNVTNMSFTFQFAQAFNQNLGSWDISKVNDMTEMLSLSGLSQANYDSTLIGWAAQTVQANVSLGAQGLTYCAGAAARDTLTAAPNNWTISGDSLTSSCLPQPKPFITTWKTSDGSITIPTTGTGYNYDVFYVNTSDSTDNGSLSAQVGDVTISGLSTSATYRVEISGDFPRIYFNAFSGSRLANSRKIQGIQQWGDISWTSMARAFTGCQNLTYTATDSPNLSQVKDMSLMFSSASVFNGDIGNWNTQNV
ncbi:MAG: BspA family leucine-rich repeat surface protein, partial [Bacteroidota bacterium]